MNECGCKGVDYLGRAIFQCEHQFLFCACACSDLNAHFLVCHGELCFKKCTVYHILNHLFPFLLCALCGIHISPRGDSFRLTGCLLCVEHTYHDIGAFNIVKRMYFYRFCIDNFIRKRAISMELDACLEAKKLPCND